ncbi:MAG: hypothetical protein IPP05_17305 [Cytophagaceae bacterium]|nr:hypothetical protein [Cytophagaceae bacterium]
MIPNFSGTYTQRKYFLDTLRSLIIDDAEYYLKPLDYNLNCERNELIEFINNYNQKYPEENNSIIYQKRRGKNILDSMRALFFLRIICLLKAMTGWSPPAAAHSGCLFYFLFTKKT